MNNAKKYFVTAIGTNIGKTIVSSVLVNALKADYWKPLQCGDLEGSDSDFIRFTSDINVHEEKYRLKIPASPHQAASIEGINIQLDDFILPQTQNALIVEGAGGMLVPLNENGDMVIDIAKKFNLPLIIVSSFYLGSINHTLLTLEYAKREKMEIALLIFNGEVNEWSLNAIKQHFPEIKIVFIPHFENISKEIIQTFSEEFAKNFAHELV